MANLYDVLTHLVRTATGVSEERRQELQNAVNGAYPDDAPKPEAVAPEPEPATETEAAQAQEIADLRARLAVLEGTDTDPAAGAPAQEPAPQE